MPQPEPGQIFSADLTVNDADAIRDFYSSVVGWRFNEIDMGGYADYLMTSADGQPRAGVCHARGVNDYLPPVWIVYIVVEDLDASIEACTRGGGSLIGDVRNEGGYRIAILQDPAGAVMGITQLPASDEKSIEGEAMG